MANILLLNPPGSQLHLRDQYCSAISKANYYWAPVDLLMQSGILSKEHSISVIDAIIENLNIDDCLERVRKCSPNYVIFLTGIRSWKEDFCFAEQIKNATGAKLIASGDYLLTEYYKFMEKFKILDAVLLDFTSDCVLYYIKNEFEKLTDICYRRDNDIILAPKSNYKVFNIPSPLHELFPIKLYRLPHNKKFPFATVLTNYGCPYQCSFCIAERIDFKYRPVENIVPELEKLVDLGVKEIFFKDFTFGIPKDSLKQLCEIMISKFPKLSWICSTRVNVVDEDMLKLMKKAGCHTIQFGVENASQVMLDGYNKNITVERIISTFHLCKRLGIKTLAHFIIGLPGDTEESVMETIKLAKNLKCSYASFNIAVPLPRTTLRDICIANNWLKEEQDELLSNWSQPVIETPYIARKRLIELRNYAVRSFYFQPSYILNTLADISSPRKLLSISREALSLLKTTLK